MKKRVKKLANETKRNRILNVHYTPHQVYSLKRMNVFQKLSSSSDYFTAQTSSLFYSRYSHCNHWSTETYGKLPRPLVRPCVTVSSIEPFHLFSPSLMLLCKPEIGSQNAASFPLIFLWAPGHSEAVTNPYSELSHKIKKATVPRPPEYHRAPRLCITS